MRAILLTPPVPPPPKSQESTPVEPPLQSMPRRVVIGLTLMSDAMILLLALGLGILLQVLTLSIWTDAVDSAAQSQLEWMPCWTLLTTALWFGIGDSYRSLRAFARLPFDYPSRVVRWIYWRRFETIFWAIASYLVLLCLCLLLPNQPFVSKLFLTVLVAGIAFAVRKSIPSPGTAFAFSTSIFSLVMFIIAIA